MKLGMGDELYGSPSKDIPYPRVKGLRFGDLGFGGWSLGFRVWGLNPKPSFLSKAKLKTLGRSCSAAPA